MAPHKKQVDYSGQTWLAKACAKGKLEMVKQRLEERPGDLDVGDHAKNTPLHIASIDGYAEVVKLLLDSGCVVDPINEAKDTPLHDAIENGHVEVVKLLLDAGANPQKANSKGEDPYDLIDRVDDHNVAEEMREAIIAAKEKSSGLRKSSEDEETPDLDSHMSHVSPRQTPPAHENQFFGSTSRRNAGTRAVKTSDRILYQRLDSSELRKAAASNDVESIARILEVHSNHLDDPRSLIIAAKAGHHEVVNLMFGLGGFHPDPDPLKDMGESATPILAAIGRGNLKVIELLLNQPNFDPTRLIDGATYYEISKRRGGHFWIEEEAMLRKAFEKYKAEHPSSKKPRSPGLRRDGRDVDRDTRRQNQREESEASRSHKRTTSSPKIKESETSKTQPKSANPASQSKDSQSNNKRGPGRPKKDEGAISEAMSDDENTPLGPPRQKLHVKRSESDVAVASESETASKPRRKLVSGKEFRGERELEKQRRASITSNASNASVKDRRESENRADRLGRKASPNLRRSSKSGHTDHDLTSENPYSDKEKDRSIKRDVSKDRLTAIREQSPTKRPRTSATPPRSSLHEVSGHDSGEVPQKRRKLEGDSKSVRKTEGASSSSPDHRTSTSTTKAIHDNTSTKSSSDAKDKARSNHRLLNSTDSSRHASEEGSRKQAETTARLSKSKVDNDVRMEEAKASSAVKAKADLEAQNRREKEEQELKERAEKDAREKRLEEERIEELARQDRLAKELAEREEEAKRQQESERKERQQEAERKERQQKEDEEAR
jgi:ankyrin repeat protein